MSRIDVHHHMLPAIFDEALTSIGGDPSMPLPKWSPEMSIKSMDSTKTAIAILSISTPGLLWFEPERAIKLARQINEFATNLRESNPERFGFFAVLPDIFQTQAALDEIAYSLDVLKADGVCLFTRYGKGHNYLGHEAFKPIWAALNSRHAVVFIHPTHPVDHTVLSPYMPQAMLEYPNETCKTAVNMIFAGTQHNNPNCKVILSHAGGTLPYLIERAVAIEPMFRGKIPSEEQIRADAKSFYFDLALSSSKNILDTLLKWAPMDHILYGSDSPYAPASGILNMSSQIEEYEMDDDVRKMIFCENAHALFPRLAKSKEVPIEAEPQKIEL